MEFLGGIDAESGMYGGMEIGQGNGILDRFLGQLVGNTVCSLVIEAATGKQEAKALRMMSATSTAVESSRSTELGAHSHQGLVEQVVFGKASDKGGQGIVQFLDEEVLLELALVVSVPSGAV